MSALLAPSYIDSWFKYDLTLRSRTKCGVSKGGQQSRCIPSFETHAFGVLLRMRWFGFTTHQETLYDVAPITPSTR
jgi:hypothetical protein